MPHKFKKGDQVRWNSEVGHVQGTVVEIHTADTEFKGKHRRASSDEPQYEVKSDKTGATAMHKEGALEKIG
ncbi:MAG TPA: DUF2945 domain-containing protein [Pseudomonas xinjiangensis]|uniref:DUF2945 domain-containing protein n=2 Tax=root TaxID=1 RepID=A0A7V1BN85_9GAMM|nr:DUF2945 domain-containing protein [Halopseudomonas xinjiangensis]HEC49253.1 DUF2945 domain-containing protein [Halopseudomonas xinjiangensis]